MLDALKLLEKAQFVKVVKEEHRSKGRGRKEYRITLQGLVAVLQSQPRYVDISVGDVRSLARVNVELLPKIFNRWTYFRDKDVEDLAYDALLNSVADTDDEVSRLVAMRGPPKIEVTPEMRECIHRHDIYAFMLVGAWAYVSSWIRSDKSVDDFFRWLEAIRDSSDLLETAKKEAERLQGEAEEDADFWLRCKSILDGQLSVPLLPGPKFDKVDQKNAPHRKIIRDYWLYRRARAMETGEPLPTLEDSFDELVALARKGEADWLQRTTTKPERQDVSRRR